MTEGPTKGSTRHPPNHSLRPSWGQDTYTSRSTQGLRTSLPEVRRVGRTRVTWRGLFRRREGTGHPALGSSVSLREVSSVVVGDWGVASGTRVTRHIVCAVVYMKIRKFVKVNICTIGPQIYEDSVEKGSHSSLLTTKGSPAPKSLVYRDRTPCRRSRYGHSRP